MKKYLLITSLMLMFFSITFAQKAPYKVVFDVTTMDTVVHHMVIKWIKEILTSNPEANIEIVFYGKSLDMITKGKSVVPDEVIKYAADKNVAFKVCQVAMKSNSIDKSQLLQGVNTVPDGIYEIVSRQHDGWAYIKAGR